MLTPNQLRSLYLDFFAGKLAAAQLSIPMAAHAIVPSSPLVPENDPTTLFTGSGMQPMMPYLLGEKHPKGVRIGDSQKCFRAEDIEEIGDNRHSTFFEMLGNWSLGDYFKREQLTWFFYFLTELVGLKPERLFVTVFGGNTELGVERDDESVAIWQDLFAKVGITAEAIENAKEKGMQGGRIFFYDEKKNWWSRAGVPANMPVGEPGGPDSEVFYDFGAELQLHENSPFKDEPCHVNCDCGRFLEIGNSVFMKYQKTATGFEELPQKNVDFGGGFERILAASQEELDVFNTAIFAPLMTTISQVAGQEYKTSQQKASFRVIADHVRAAVMLINDGVFPGNKEQGYVVRRLIRRAVRHGKMLGIEQQFIAKLVSPMVELYQEAYPTIAENQTVIEQALHQEEAKFLRTIAKGLKEFDKAPPVVTAAGEDKQSLSGELSFKLYETFGFPLELTIEEAQLRGFLVPADIQTSFTQAKTAHQDASRTATAGKFKGGLQDQSVITTKYHTATHLLHKALRQVLGDHVAQKGSNITVERLRFDFSHPEPINPEQLAKIESLMNEWIAADYSVTKTMMAKQAALDSGALAFFVEKYPDEVSVYTVGKSGEDWISRELCGGPHVTHTGEIGSIKIVKEKAIAAGIRRIYAELVA
jgi:alanyl-tRNA synthetase